MPLKRVVLLVLAALSWLAASTPESRRILLISIDTLRAGHLGCYGYPKGTSPNIDALAKDSLVFTSAFTTAPLTLPAHASMLTGLYPAHHGMRDNAFFETGNPPLISEILRKKGFATAAFVSGAPLLSSFGLNRGFDVYDDSFTGAERPAAETTDLAARWMEAQHGSFFAWVHYFDPHAEYTPPAGFRNFALPYDGEIAYVDSQIPRLMKAAGKNAVVLLVADHGESLGDHGESTHGIFLYNATLQVPLILHVAGAPPGIRNTFVTLCDIAPTLLALAGADAPAMDGVSLLARIPERTLMAESLYAARNFGYAPLFAAIRDQRKFILAPQPEFYDLAADAAEARNIVKQGNTGAWASAARDYAQTPDTAKAQSMTEEEREKLRSLGYVSSSALKAGAVDPKERIRQIEQFNQAMGLLSRSEFPQAESAFRAIAKEDPGSLLGRRFLGDALAAQGKFAEAAQAYDASMSVRPDPETAVRLAKSQFQAGSAQDAKRTLENAVRDFPGYDPAAFELASLYIGSQKFDAALQILQRSSPEAHNQRGIVYLRLKEYDDAEREFRAALQLQARPQYWNNLGLALQRLNRADEAEEAYRSALSQDPGYQECEVNLAFLLVQQQKWELALAHLEHLIDANPKMWNARLARAYALENLGRRDEALNEYKRLLDDAPADWPQRPQVQSRIEKLEK